MGPHSALRGVVSQCNGQFGAKITTALKKGSGCLRFQGVILISQPKRKARLLCMDSLSDSSCFVKDNLEPLENSLSDLGSGALSAQIRSEVLALDENGIDGSVDLGGGLDVTERRQ